MAKTPGILTPNTTNSCDKRELIGQVKAPECIPGTVTMPAYVQLDCEVVKTIKTIITNNDCTQIVEYLNCCTDAPIIGPVKEVPAPQLVEIVCNSLPVSPVSGGDREIVFRCTQAGETVSLQYDVLTNPPTLLSAFNISTNSPFVGAIADLVACNTEQLDFVGPVNFCAAGNDVTRTDIFDAKTSSVIGSFWQDNTGAIILPPATVVKGQCHEQTAGVFSGPVDYCLNGVNYTRTDKFNFFSGMLDESIWQDDTGAIVPAPVGAVKGKCSVAAIDRELLKWCDTLNGGAEVLVQYDVTVSPPVVISATYVASGLPYLGLIENLSTCPQQVIIPETAPVIAIVGTKAGVNISVPGDMLSVSIVKTGGVGTLQLTMNDLSVYPITDIGEVYNVDANISGFYGKLPPIPIVAVGGPATWKWHGTY